MSTPEPDWLTSWKGNPSSKLPRGWQPGESGYPAGRPPGIVDKRKRVTQMLGERAESVVKQAIDMALAGDPVALPIVLARIAPALKPTDEAAPFQLDVSLPLEQQGLAVLRAIAAGDLTLDQGERMLKLVHSIASLRDVDTLTRRLDELEREVREGKNTGTPGNVQRT